MGFSPPKHRNGPNARRIESWPNYQGPFPILVWYWRSVHVYSKKSSKENPVNIFLMGLFWYVIFFGISRSVLNESEFKFELKLLTPIISRIVESFRLKRLIGYMSQQHKTKIYWAFLHQFETYFTSLGHFCWICDQESAFTYHVRVQKCTGGDSSDLCNRRDDASTAKS